MHKRIPCSQLRPGMMLAGYEGRWFDHPFWRSRLKLRSAHQVAKMQASPIEWVIIDTTRGLDTEDEDAGARPAATAGSPPLSASPMIRGLRRAAANVETAGAPPAPTPRAALARDFGRAAKAIAQTEKRISRVFFEVRLGKSIKAATIEPVITQVLEAVRHNTGAFFGLLMSRSDGELLYRHALAVSGLMITLARQMGLPEAEVRKAGMAGLFLDCGIALVKPPEADAVDAHLAGQPADEVDPSAHIESGARFLLRSGLDPAVVAAAREHHERMDGSGYPLGLEGGAISQLGRMAAICDCYDDLLNPEDGSRGLDPAAAVRQMLDNGIGFDPLLLGRFIEAIGAYPVGAFVRLRSGRPAMVVGLDPLDSALPTVIAFEERAPDAGDEPGPPPELIDLAACYGADGISGMVDPLDCGFPDAGLLRDALFGAAQGRKAAPARRADPVLTP